MIASPGGKLSGNRLFGTDFLTEEECGRQLTMTTHLKTCSSGESCNGPMRRPDVLYELSGFCPHSSSDPFGATFPPGGRDFLVRLHRKGVRLRETFFPAAHTFLLTISKLSDMILAN